MNQAKALFKQFMALQMRERVLAVAALIGVLYFLFDLTLLRPQRTEARALVQQISQLELERAALKQTAQALQLPAQNDPLARQRAERDELRANFDRAQALLSHAASSEIRLGDVVRTAVGSRRGLVLVQLRTLPSEVVFNRGGGPVDKAAAPASSPDSLPTLYKHGIEVTVQGTYADLLAFMLEMEKNSKGVFWGDARLAVVVYPEATLKMTIHTLSSRPELAIG